MQTVTMKNKKSEIYNAYEELLKDYNEVKARASKATKIEKGKQKIEQELVKTASDYTVESSIKGIANLKLDLSKTLTDLSDKLGAEAEKLVTPSLEVT